MKAVSVQENQGTLAECVAGKVDGIIVAGIQVSVVGFDKFSHYEFEPPAAFFTRSAMGQYYFYHTSVRDKAQAAADELLGKGLYTVLASKMKQGGRGKLTVTGTQTRRGQKR